MALSLPGIEGEVVVPRKDEVLKVIVSGRQLDDEKK